MKILLTILLVSSVLLPGCSSQPVKVWWNPLTWGTNRAATVQQLGARQDTNSDKLNGEAMREVFKTGEVLKAAPAENRAVQVAIRTNANAYSLLALANGPLGLDAIQADRETITQLLSANADLRASGEKAQARAETAQAGLSKENEELRAAMTEAQKKLATGYESERKLANTVRNFWFVVGGLVFLLILGRLLSFASQFVPALSGAARVVNGLAAPALEAAEARARAGLQNVGAGLAAVRARLPALLEEVKHLPDGAARLEEKLTRTLDSKLDTDHQLVIGAAANTAPRA